ncbi:MAG: YebC/PmpR family DNA-binding transcriptional regulator [Bacilli bacterium]|nr:YebC/PmpR family DNA-binding transcriptional regulator [Bacilli bacterium]
MAGHSKWSNIKRRKEAQDAVRGKIFQKLAKEIYVAAKSGDKDPKNNANLRMVVEKAKSANMPNDRIDKAIEKAHSVGNAEDYESVLYEGYGPGGIAIMVDTLTDNRNRTASMVRTAFTKNGGNLGTDGSVSYLFERKGIIVVSNKYNEEDVMMNVIENGALDFKVNDDSYEIITEPEDFIKVKEGLEKGIDKFIASEITFLPQLELEVSEAMQEKVLNIIEALEELDDVQNVYYNMKEE